MKTLSFFTFMLFATLLKGQMSLADSLKSLPCTQAETQLEMNECSALQFQIADSIMNALFNEISQYQTQLIIDLETPDADLQYIRALKDQHISFTASQLFFTQYRDSMAKNYYLGYYGGSMAPMIYNIVCTQLTVERFELLKEMQAEFY